MAKGDVERGTTELYPGMIEPPEIRWAFIRKVYAIVAMQILLTIAVASVVVFVKPIHKFLASGTPGLVLLIVVFILTLLLICPLFAYRKRHPWNFVLLVLFTILLSFTLGVACAFSKGEKLNWYLKPKLVSNAHWKIILEAFILTGAAVAGLTLYTFWAVKRGKDFSFLGPFLSASLLFFFRVGKVAHMIYGLMGAIIFSGYIVYDTNNLIKRYTYDEYITAAIELYLDIVNIFIAFLQMLGATD
ncbi:protein lifeguard 4 [Citrus sinensis]|nr:protein lifeguard 4 [Citrus sinensis]